MTPTIPKEGSQKRRIYDALITANGDWVNGRYFLRELYLSQYHRASPRFSDQKIARRDAE